MSGITIAIDGPSGAGKSTTARGLAGRLGYTYIDTGAMYRAVALKGIEAGVGVEDAEGTTGLAESSRITFERDSEGVQRVLLDGRDVTEAIRSPEATRLTSPVSAIPGVRRVLVAQQRSLGAGGGVVMEGRDIGTIVFPNAELKVFLTASDQERALRRWKELKAKGQDVSVEEVHAQLSERDARDSSRADSPLVAAPDAVMLVSDGLTLDQVISRIADLAASRGA
jgi:cytidylate kinase